MDQSVTAVIEECTIASDAGAMTFPQVLGKLAAVGIEGYYADLRRFTKTYYSEDGGAVEVGVAVVPGSVALVFDAAGVEAAVRQAQAGTVTYHQFCEKVMAAGCAGYHVSMPGRRVVYLGRTAETHVEHFPGAP